MIVGRDLYFTPLNQQDLTGNLFKMTKVQLVTLLDEILKPEGFKRKGNSWYRSDEELIKKVQLQKSSFGNFYYINYGFDIKELELVGLAAHIYLRLGSMNERSNKEIIQLLDLDVEVPEEARKSKLTSYINEQIITEFKNINTAQDLLKYIQRTGQAFLMPLVVQKYFGLQSS